MNHIIHPAYLWIGPHISLVEKTIIFLQQTLCPANGNDNCLTCQQIAQQQHYAVIWLAPEKNYTIEQLEPITNRIIFSLEENQHCFFVIQHADYLSHSCSNSLLKSVEEPPRGYHFIFLAERAQAIAPTIRSRCIVQSFFSEEKSEHHSLFPFFTTLAFDPLKFEKELSGSKINEQESIELLNGLLSHWIQKYKAQVAENSQSLIHTEKIIALLTTTLKKPPMPGSSTIFWRNIFLQFMETAKDTPQGLYKSAPANSRQTA